MCHDYLHSLATDGEGSPAAINIVKDDGSVQSGSNGEAPTVHIIGGAPGTKGSWTYETVVDLGVANTFVLSGDGTTTQTTTRKERSVVTVTETLRETMGHGEL